MLKMCSIMLFVSLLTICSGACSSESESINAEELLEELLPGTQWLVMVDEPDTGCKQQISPYRLYFDETVVNAQNGIRCAGTWQVSLSDAIIYYDDLETLPPFNDDVILYDDVEEEVLYLQLYFCDQALTFLTHRWRVNGFNSQQIRLEHLFSGQRLIMLRINDLPKHD